MKNLSSDFQKNFSKGKKISWYIFFLLLLFFVFWVLGHTREHIISPSSSFFQNLFFFVNPNVFYKCFVKGEFLSLLTGAVDLNSFIFIISYLITFFSFIAVFILSVRLFVISWITSVRQFHWISCCALIPIVSVFFVGFFVLRSLIYKYQVKTRGSSKYDDNFEPEYFEEKLIDDLSEETLSKRCKTDEFTIKHYNKMFHPNRTPFLKFLIGELSRYLS